MNPRRFIPGIDEPLPPGEELLWTGTPTVSGQLRQGLFLRFAAVWLVVAALLPTFRGTAVEGSTAAHLGWVGVVGLVVLALAAGWAWLVRRTTVYAVTDRRVVMKIGVALPSILNIPLEQLSGAACRGYGDGSGEITLPLADRSELGWALLWPHVRPWRVARAEPALRWIEDVDEVASLLTAAAVEAGRFEATGSPAPRRRTPPARPGLDGRVARA